MYDSRVGGFGARITAAGARSFILNYRVNRRERRHTIGRFPAWSVRQAREEAASLKRDIDRGRDPVREREAERMTPTIADLADRYIREHAEAKKKPKSIEEDRRNLRLHICPWLGKLMVAAVAREDIAKLHHSMSGVPISANRVLSLLSKMLALAEIWGLRPQNTNPCRGIDRYRELSRERLVSGRNCPTWPCPVGTQGLLGRSGGDPADGADRDAQGRGVRPTVGRHRYATRLDSAG